MHSRRNTDVLLEDGEGLGALCGSRLLLSASVFCNMLNCSKYFTVVTGKTYLYYYKDIIFEKMGI